jgi:hypothetical protein
MNNLVFLLEESSMKETLENVLPHIIPNDIPFLCISHEGKGDLEKSIPRKLLRWRDPDAKFIIVHDQDSGNCKELKKALTLIIPDRRKPDTLIRNLWI